MGTTRSTKQHLAATVLMWTALGVAVAALTLWFLHVIGPPAGIIGGATAVIVMMGAGRYRKRADR